LRVGLIHKDWPVMIPIGGRTSYAGDVLAVVVADTRDRARAAAKLVDVTYEVHTPNTDARAALADDAPLSVWGTDSNVLSTSAYTRGADFDEAFAASAFTVHETFHTQRIEHAFLEPESTVAIPSDDGGEPTLHVYSGGQGVWDDRNDIAAVLGVDPSKVTVELVSNGGAFGGKEDMSNQAQTALAAWLLGRPVKCTLTREESFRMHAKRHPIELEYWAGCDADGRVTALKVRGIGDSGAYASVGMKVLERAAGHACGPYRWPALDIETIAVRTNNLVCGAFRGFGANQAQFAMEGVLDRLAEQVGISGWEIRKRNVIRPGQEWGPGQIMDDGAGGAEACLDRIRASYDDAIAAGKAVGLGLGLKNSGLGNGFREVSKAVIRFLAPVGDAPGRIEVRHGWTEMGQGVHTVALQVAAQELGVEPDRIDVIVDTTPRAGLRPDDRIARDPDGRRLRERCGGCGIGGRLRDRRRLRGRVRRRLDPEARRPVGREPDDPRRVQFRRAVGDRRSRDRRHREGRRRPRRRQGGQPDARRGTGRGVGAHGARLRAE
jgi:aldehyde oxidoreductase